MGMRFHDPFGFLVFNDNSYWFNRETKDQNPWKCVEKDGKLIVVVNALGVAKENISIEVQGTEENNKQLLVVKGSTHNDVLDKDYSISMFWETKPLNQVEWDVKDGLLQMEIEFEQPVQPKVLITRK